MLQAALDFVRARHDAHLAELKDFLSIPSISTLPENREDTRRAGEWVAAALRALKMTRVELLETSGHPVVYGEWLGAPGRPTVLVYGHYDVQPVDPLDEWDSGPFAGEVRGDYIFARGASDMKGQVFAQFKAMEAIFAQGDYPFNVKYMIEGEEEIGSPNLPGFIEEYKEMLACDVVLNCDSMILGLETPSIIYSLRGLTYYDLELRTAEHDLHSGRFGGAILNPLHVISELIAGMHDAQGRVTLPGFYDEVIGLDEEERALLRRLPHSDDAWLAMAGAGALYGEEGYTTIERLGARPTLEINGIWGGFSGAGAKTVLPAKANAKISMRLVPNQNPEEMERRLRAYLDLHMPAGATYSLEQHSCSPGAVMDRKSKYMASAAGAMETVYGKPPVFDREGGSVPVVGMMQKTLGVDSIMMGFALPSDGIHGPNERQHLPNLYRGMEVYIRFLLSL